jgi:polyisoprenoid-binding protein YceI
MRSPFAPILVPLAALVASLVRWWLQGSNNLYTALSKRFYIADPDLGYRVSVQHPIWLGLEVCALIAVIATALAVAGWLVRRREARRERRATVLRVACWLVAAAPLAVPIAAFASGPGVVGGLDTGIAGALAAPAGRYEVVAHDGSSVTAHLSAGHEAFDARFGGVRGAWRGDPHDLAQAMTAEITADPATVDTGIGERSKHAREEYLHADRYPALGFTLGELIAARQDGADAIAFRARGTVALIGRQHAVEVTGALRRADAAALARLGLTGDVLLAQVDFAVVIKDTALAPDAGDFDGDRIPIHVSLVLRHTGG